ncbi:MAG: hypothetical protein EBR10_01930 [Planctomycetes bacterium]|nr:hypothetical protein [Planctomycetota bacterium]
MPVVCELRTKRLVWLVVYIVVCFALGVWGAYDYWIRIPHDEQRFRDYETVKGSFDSLQKKADEGRTLNADERKQYEESKKRVAEYQPPPSPVPAWDRPLQLYVYVIGCGVISTPWLIWSLQRARRKRVELSDLSDTGVLRGGETTIEVRQVTEVDMSRWMSKSIAVVRGPAGASIEIDDYLLQDGEKVVGFFANRFHPSEWTTEARRVVASESDGQASDDATAATPTELP